MRKSTYVFNIFLGLVICMFTSPQLLATTSGDNDTIKKVSPEMHHEIPEGEYLNISLDEMLKSPAYRDDGSNYITVQANVTWDGDNIIGDAANEPSIAIDPTNPDKMVIGWRQFDTQENSFRQAGYAYTFDGGDTWTFPGVIDPGVFRSDPVLAADSNGNIYYNSLTVLDGDFYCDVFIMRPGSTDWDEVTYAQGGDKQWMIVDQSGGIGNGHIYAFWTSSYSICFPDQFTRSIDAGESFEDCVTITGMPFWGTLATDQDGILYSGGWSDFGYIVSKSSTAQDPELPVSWEPYSVVDLDGSPGFGDGPNPGGLLGQTWIAIDNSDGPNSGNVYMLASSERYSNSDPVDVMFARSTDGGLTWDAPLRVNQDENNSNWQWHGTMSVAPDGRIDVVWLDTRNAISGYFSALYYSYSTDGGVSFSQNERISELFDPHLGWPQQDKMGDYFHMISDNDYAHLAWANTLNGEQDVYYTRINPWFVGIDERITNERLSVNCYPNPSNNQLTVKTRVESDGEIEIALIDLLGNVVNNSIESVNAGTHTVQIETASLPQSIYYLKVSVNGKSLVTKVVVSH